MIFLIIWFKFSNSLSVTDSNGAPNLGNISFINKFATICVVLSFTWYPSTQFTKLTLYKFPLDVSVKGPDISILIFLKE